MLYIIKGDHKANIPESEKTKLMKSLNFLNRNVNNLVR